MAGDKSNVRNWSEGIVYTAPTGSTKPTDPTAALAAAWEDIGILDQDAGLVETRSEDRTEKYGWGAGLVRVVRSKHKRTFKIVALEDNPVVRALRDPGSVWYTSGGVTTTEVVVPQPNARMFIIEESDGAITRRRIIDSGEVFVSGDIEDKESAVAQVELTLEVYPNASDVLWTEISNDTAIESA